MRDGQIGKRKQELKAASEQQGRDGVIERWKDNEQRRCIRRRQGGR